MKVFIIFLIIIHVSISHAERKKNPNPKKLSDKISKVLICAICGKDFPSNSHLIIHNRTHTGEKPYECITCHRQFANKTNLTTHSRIHTNEKSYECITCHRQFSYKVTLKRHIKNKHKIELHTEENTLSNTINE